MIRRRCRPAGPIRAEDAKRRRNVIREETEGRNPDGSQRAFGAAAISESARK